MSCATIATLASSLLHRAFAVGIGIIKGSVTSRCIDMRIDMGTGMCVDMCLDMRIGMRIDTSIRLA